MPGDVSRVEHAACRPLDSAVTRDALLKLDRMCEGLEKGDWAGFLRDWDRALRAGNHPETTRYNYLLAAAQLAKYLADESPDPDADDADDACSPTPSLTAR